MLRAWRESRDHRSVPAGRLSQRLRLHALPNAFIATAVQFSVGAAERPGHRQLPRHWASSSSSYPVTFTLYLSADAGRARCWDPIGSWRHERDHVETWTPIEKNVALFALEGPMLGNRLLWLGIALVMLAFIYLRFRFAHRTETGLLSRLTRRCARTAPHARYRARTDAISVPRVRQSFGFATHARQTLAIAWILVLDDREERGRARSSGGLPDAPGAGADGRVRALGSSAAAREPRTCYEHLTSPLPTGRGFPGC